MISTRLEINGKEYPMVNELPLSLNYVQADIREPDKRNASFTKTIQLFGTNATNKLFENIFSYNVVTNTFNVNKKTPCKYYYNNLLQFQGDLQLLRVTRNKDKNIIYDCNIIGQGGSLFVDISNGYLTDLDFSTYNHTYSRDKILASWSNICDVATVPTTLTNGQGYLYGFVQRGLTQSESVFNVSDFLPQLYLREYVSKILSAKGYTFTSAFLDSAEFKSIVVEPNISNVSLSQLQLDNSQFNVGLTTDLVATSGVDVYPNFNDETAPFFDLGNQYTAGVATVAQNGIYNLAAQIKTKIRVTNSNGLVTACKTGNQRFNVAIQKSSNNGASWFTLANNPGVTNQNYNALNVSTDYFQTFGVATGSIFLSAGDQIRVVYKFTEGTTVNVPFLVGTPTWTMTVLSGATQSSFYMLATDKKILEGNTMIVNNALPKNIKQVDFLKSVIQAFNLYIQPDKTNPKNLIIEPYLDYFNGSIVDWENKIDKSKDIITNPISLVDGKQYKFTYKKDGDFYNTKYEETYLETFGTEIIDIDNDFIKAEKKNELIFSPTPLVANYALGVAVPKIYKEDPLISGATNFTPNIRLLYYGGIKQTSNSWTFKKAGAADLVSNNYPFVGHIDDAETPTVDLNFGTPLNVYYSFVNSSFTNNNLFNRFHKPLIDTITNRDSKVIVAHLYLTPKDIYLFSFRNKYFIDGAYYLVNGIFDYNPMEVKSTKCELIKILDLPTFTPTVTKFTNVTDIPTGASERMQNGTNSLNLGNSVVLGDNCIVVGDNNYVPASANNITIIGDNITIPENTSNLTYINGAVIPTITGESTPIKTVTANYNISVLDGTILADATARNIIIDMSIVTDTLALNTVSFQNNGTQVSGVISKIFNIKKIDSSVNTVTIDNGIDLIDGVGTKVLTTQYESISLQWDGTNYHVIQIDTTGGGGSGLSQQQAEGLI